MERRFKKSFFVLCAGIAIALIIIIIAVLFSMHESIKNGDEPNIFGFIPTIVVTGSMEPTINVDSLNLYKTCTTDDISVGDIVVFWSDEHQVDVIHRAVEIKDINGIKSIITKGDANKAVDLGYVTNENIVGEVTHTFNWSVPYVQSIMNADRTGINSSAVTMWLIILTLGLWLILSGIYCMIVGILWLFDWCLANC